MGRTTNNNLKSFTREDVLNRKLVINMLKFEDQLGKSERGQSMYKNKLNEPQVSLTIEKALQRMTLSNFKFNTSEESLANYRSIFLTYFNSPDDYDKDVIESVYYMRENKCVFYKSKVLTLDDKIPDVPLFQLDGKTPTTLHTQIDNSKYTHTLFGAFSLT